MHDSRHGIFWRLESLNVAEGRCVLSSSSFRGREGVLYNEMDGVS